VSQLFGWRRKFCDAGAARFAAVRVAAEASTAGLIEIEFANGARMRISGAVDCAKLSAVIAALADGKRRS
jgi:transposase